MEYILYTYIYIDVCTCIYTHMSMHIFVNMQYTFIMMWKGCVFDEDGKSKWHLHRVTDFVLPHWQGSLFSEWTRVLWHQGWFPSQFCHKFPIIDLFWKVLWKELRSHHGWAKKSKPTWLMIWLLLQPGYFVIIHIYIYISYPLNKHICLSMLFFRSRYVSGVVTSLYVTAARFSKQIMDLVYFCVLV